MPEHVSLAEAAERLGISRSLAYRRADSGQLPTIEHGGRRRVLVDELDNVSRRTSREPRTLGPGARLSAPPMVAPAARLVLHRLTASVTVVGGRALAVLMHTVPADGIERDDLAPGTFTIYRFRVPALVALVAAFRAAGVDVTIFRENGRALDEHEQAAA
jgi:excisionase family DNA binding protein